jgi:hypothetical protein
MAKMNALKRLPMILPTLILEAASVTTKIRGRHILPANVAIEGMTIARSCVNGLLSSCSLVILSRCPKNY